MNTIKTLGLSSLLLGVSLLAQNSDITVTKVDEVKDIVIKIPAVPAVPKVPNVVTHDAQGNKLTTQTIEDIFSDRKVVFSNRVAPARFNKNKSRTKTTVLTGDVNDGRVAAYLHLPLISVAKAKEILSASGFSILNTFNVDKKGEVVSIVFSNEHMQIAANEKTRGFASTLRLIVDNKNKIVTVPNPMYIMKAFMQEEYKQELAVATLKQLREAFPDMKNSHEIVKFRTLDKFQFMENMPYYENMKVVASAKNSILLDRAIKSKKIVYKQKLENGNIVLGVALGKRTSKFVKKIGFQNAGLLPYPVLIENGKAKILAPEYYIAVMYPQLKMSQFMKIATVPGAITKDIDKIFR